MPHWPFGEGGTLIFALAAATVFAAAIVQNTTGMGFGQVAAPLLLLIDPRFVPVAVLLMGMTVALFGAVRDRRDVARGDLGVALAGRVTGALVAGQLVAVLADSAAFSLLFAGLILLAVVLSVTSWKVQPTRGALLTGGFVSGFMGTITSVGAPPMGIVYQNSPGPRVRATLNVFFALGALVSVLALLAWGQVEAEDLWLAISLAPAFLLGSWVSKFLTGFVDRRFRPLVLLVCACSAVVIIWKVL
ncbi:MAG: sulfite exporter TauE/SafE family protein [Hyphomicrobiales bacterium]|nr:sulfite exporter TauE/SafE family protein [Hyphomicrobiales bacterium]